MFLFRKLGQWLDMLVGVFVERTDDRFSVERRLQYDRQQRAEQLKRQRTLAVDVGAYAVELAQDLGEAVVEVEDLRSQARDAVARANAAKARGDARAEEEELARASQLAEELAEAEAHLTQLNAEKDAALKDKEEAYAIIEDGIAQLRAQARQDSRLARRAGMAELRERSLEMREKLAQMIPEDRDDTREQIEQKLQKREAKLEARRELTDRLISRERDQRVRARQEISAKGRTNLSELFAEVGYTPTAVDAAARRRRRPPSRGPRRQRRPSPRPSPAPAGAAASGSRRRPGPQGRRAERPPFAVRIKWSRLLVALLILVLFTYGGAVLLGLTRPGEIPGIGAIPGLGGILGSGTPQAAPDRRPSAAHRPSASADGGPDGARRPPPAPPPPPPLPLPQRPGRRPRPPRAPSSRPPRPRTWGSARRWRCRSRGGSSPWATSPWPSTRSSPPTPRWCCCTRRSWPRSGAWGCASCPSTSRTRTASASSAGRSCCSPAASTSCSPP